MGMNRMKAMGAVIASVGLLGVAVSFGAENEPSAFGRTGNQGEGFSSEQKGSERLDRSTRGPRNPESSASQDAQITMGGARPTIEGEVLKIQGENYTIRDRSGGEVRVRVDNNTNMDCAMGQTKDAKMATGRQTAREDQEIPPTRGMQQRGALSEEQKGSQIIQEQQPQEQQERMGQQSGTQSSSAMGQHSGGDIAKGSGFEVGSKSGCTFKTGDKVKAEVSDLGTVLFLKKTYDKDMSPSESMGRGPQMLPESR
jgi:uncharacterized protein YdeI (BOF family)